MSGKITERSSIKRLIEVAMKRYDEKPERLASRLREEGIKISAASLYNFLNGRNPSANLELLLRDKLLKLIRKAPR